MLILFSISCFTLHNTQIFGNRASENKYPIQPDLGSMSQIQISTPRVQNYDPLLCKTCQKLALDNPKSARAPYSDCEEHFHERVTNLLLTGGLVMV